MRANVLVVDADPSVVAQVQAALPPDAVVAGTAQSPETALQSAAVFRPDLLVTDVDLGLQERGIDLAASMKRRWDTTTVFLAGHVTPSIVRAAAMVGAYGILMKPLEPRQLEATFHLAVERLSTRDERHRTDYPGLERLRPREREVVRLLIQHIPVRQIAERLGISPQTVRNHLKGAFRRTGTGTQHELLQWLSDRRQ